MRQGGPTTVTAASTGTLVPLNAGKTEQKNGKIILNFNGKKVELTKEQAERYNQLFYNVGYVDRKIEELEIKKKSGKLSDKEQNELNELKAKQREQKAVTSVAISADGSSATFTMKKDIKAEDFKKLFYISDGYFSEQLKEEGLAESGYGSLDQAWMDGAYIDNSRKGLFNDGLVYKFPNGVTLWGTDDAGHYSIDHTNAYLRAGHSYSVSSYGIDPPDKGSFEDFGNFFKDVWKAIKK